jgi:hypothetical protein
LNPPLIVAEPERPFWGFGEILVTAAVFLVSQQFTVMLAYREAERYANSGVFLLGVESIAYLAVFAALALLFARYRRPLLKSLAWIRQPFRPIHLVVVGVILSVLAVLLEELLRTPNVQTPFTKLLSDAPSRILIALFGVTLAPAFEELLFRGLLQPVLIEATGVLPGILITSVIFGAVHLSQNAFIWQSGLLIALVGFVLGTVRHISGSTRASAIVHAAYNSLPCLALLLTGGQTFHK